MLLGLVSLDEGDCFPNGDFIDEDLFFNFRREVLLVMLQEVQINFIEERVERF